MLQKNFIPKKPFEEFKWKWACLAPTESINDPVVLLGVLFRMRKLEQYGYKYSSDEFAHELRDLSKDVSDSVGVNLGSRTGERNLIRNSGQYWRAVGLLADGDNSGRIHLTEFGRRVADHDISQTEFAAITIQTFRLPNTHIQSSSEAKQWINNGLIIHPLRLILYIVKELYRLGQGEQGYITVEELIRIVIPLSGVSAEIEDYIRFILWFRSKEISLIGWPNYVMRSNDARYAREYLLFLSNYGYLNRFNESNRIEEIYRYNDAIDEEINSILAEQPKEDSLQEAVAQIRKTDIVSEIERKRVAAQHTYRPNQASFRKQVLLACERCVITNVMMPEVLEAAHIKPFKYHGEDTVANGFAMRLDIHLLFDSGHLRISETGEVHLSTRARMDYGATIPPKITLPSFTNLDFIRWRWDNYNGI